MKNRFFLSTTLIIAFCALIFSGCFLKDDEEDDAPAVAVAETVTIDQVKTLGTPTGTGIAPANEADTTAAVATAMGAEEEITDALESVITYTKANFKKSIKTSIDAKVKAIKAEGEDDEDDEDDGPSSGSWNQSGTFNLVDSGYFTSGTAEYSTTGSWSDTENFAQVGNSTKFSGSETESENYSFKYKITNGQMRYKDILLNGYVNENSTDNGTFTATAETQGTETDEDDVFESLGINSAYNLSYRSGYSISGSVVCYIVVSMDFSFAVNKQFTAAELADPNLDIDQAFYDAAVPSGSMTVNVYDATGASVYSQTYTAAEIKTKFMSAGEDDEGDSEDSGK